MPENKPAATGGPPVTVDPQDPLPESNWIWRRWFTVGVCLLAFLGIGYSKWTSFTLATATLDAVNRIALTRDARALDNALATVETIMTHQYKLGIGDQVILGVSILLYMVAPSAEQVVKMLATVAAWKGGISTMSTARATEPGGKSASATVTAGPAQTAAPAAAAAAVEDDLPDYARASP